MANVYDCALVYTPQIWVEKFHRHCTNTGQLRIRSFIYDSTVLFSDSYDVAIVSDTWPALSRSLVEKIKNRGSKVIGVCDGNEAAREYLSSIGVDGVVDSKLEVKILCDEIVTLLDTLSRETVTKEKISDEIDLTLLDESIEKKQDEISPGLFSNVTTVIGTGGSGSTEISIILASRLIDSLLIDFDFEHPSLAPRANLNIEPHIIDAIESAQNLKENFLDNVNRVSKFSAIVGLTHASLATDIRDYEIKSLIDESKVHFTNVILDCGAISQYTSFINLYESIMYETTTFIIVGDCSPHGIIRILETLVIIADFINRKDDNLLKSNIEIVVNKSTSDTRLIQQIQEEIEFCGVDCNITFVQHNKEINEMAWLGTQIYPKKWLKSFDALLQRINDTFKGNRDLSIQNKNAEYIENEKLVSESL